MPILRDSKIELLAEVQEDEDVDICFINEIHIVHGTNDNLSCLSDVPISRCRAVMDFSP